MSAEYLKYIPNLVSNPQINAVLLTVAPAIAYVAAAYGHLYFGQLSLTLSILVSIFFAAVEYIIRVPIVKYSHEIAGFGNVTMQTVWIILTLILSAVI